MIKRIVEIVAEYQMECQRKVLDNIDEILFGAYVPNKKERQQLAKFEWWPQRELEELMGLA